jgi:hypothetical protein
MAVVGAWVVGVGSFPEMEDVFPAMDMANIPDVRTFAILG